MRFRNPALGALAGALASVPLSVFCILSAGGGHGIYWPMIVCFPYTMLLSVRVGSIAMPLVVLGLLQFPLYGSLVGWSRDRSKSWRIPAVLAATHMVVATLALLLSSRDSSYWP